MRYVPEEVWFPCSLDIPGWDEEFHELMLNDQLRMVAYRAAIREAVWPGAVILDLGTGTGILAQWALEAGASRVYGIEVNPKILALAERRLGEAGFADRFKPVNGLSYDVELPERVDMIISELIGNFGDNEDCHAILADARRRFLKPGGVMLPLRVTTFFVPVASPKAHEQILGGVCKSISQTHDLRRLLERLDVSDPFDIYYDVIVPERCYLSSPRKVKVFDFGSSRVDASYRIDLSFPANAAGALTGFKGYFIADLTEQIRLDISGSDVEKRTASDSWKHAYLPIRRPIDVRMGDDIKLTLERIAEENNSLASAFRYRWQAVV
jgi:predicted RNA methylase